MSTPPTQTQAPAHLEPSELGTKPYWDALYATEITNHASNPADEGAVWFDDSDAQSKIVSFLDNAAETGNLGLSKQKARVLDLGCGNGSLLFALREDGWDGRLLGVDYSAESVRLARQVSLTRKQRGQGQGDETGETETAEEELGGVDFAVWDVLNGQFTEPINPGAWDLVLDKGTFDAVSLNGERDGQGRRICEGYGERVIRLLRTGGMFLVTSCNWTERELGLWFEGTNEGRLGEGRLRQVARIEYPSFSFGGVKGQTISSLCFEKVDG